MNTISERLARFGLAAPSILLPNSEVNLEKWAVIACDQHTSNAEYWYEVDRFVGDAPSTLRLIFPEVFLEKPGEDEKIGAIHTAMRSYVQDGILTELPNRPVLVRRTTSHGVRTGLVISVDLEAYSFERGSNTPIRASEDTIRERLPARIRIRKDAPIELPHILVLFDDPLDTVLGAVPHSRANLLYETDLMFGGGRIEGSSATEALEGITAAFEELFSQSDNGFYFAVGDGNHSLATAKAIWDSIKPSARRDDPRRYALVEIMNLHDRGLGIEPIHRILFGTDGEAVLDSLGDGWTVKRTSHTIDEIARLVESDRRVIGLVAEGVSALLRVPDTASLAVESAQELVDSLAAARPDYVHGIDAVRSAVADSGAVGLLLPPVDRNAIFSSIETGGALPRKSFSLGSAAEKRYYLEARSLTL